MTLGEKIGCAVDCWRAVNSRERVCMVPGCGSTHVVDCHSQTRAYALRAIAEDGWVYQFSTKRGDDIRRAFNNGVHTPKIERTEISRASVFNGFCGIHDCELFKHIDVPKLTKDSPEQVEELYLRSLARHITVLQDNLLWMEVDNEKSGTHDQEIVQKDTEIHQAYESDLRRYWEPFWASRQEGLIKSYWRVIPRNLGVSVSTLYPMADEYVSAMWYYKCGARPLISLSIVPQVNNETHIVFAWWYEWDDVMQEFAAMLSRSNEKDFLRVVNRIVFSMSEPYCIGPKVWNRLTVSEHRALENYLRIKDIQDQSIALPQVLM